MANEVVVVMVPFLAQGHLNQLLHLSRLISTYNIPIHFISTATHNRQVRIRLHGWNPNNNLIQFHDLDDPIVTPHPIIPNTTSHPNFPTHLQPYFNSSLLLRTPVADVIRSVSQTARKVAVIHDSLMSYVVQDVCLIPNAETYIFRGLSVFYYFCSTNMNLGRELPFEPDKICQLPAPGESISPEFSEFIKLQYDHQKNHVGNVYDSSRIIEGKFVESLKRDQVNGKYHWAVGPFNPVEMDSDCLDRHICLQWLDKQPARSVLYVSFGTTTTFTSDQIAELALGLERSTQRFLWVLRDADKGDGSVGVKAAGPSHEKPLFDNYQTLHSTCRSVGLPEGFEERVAGRGLVVREWAPQIDILGHLSTGGFVSHCGWNSCMEAMTAGVAVATWPIHTDQPYNAFLLSNVLGVAVVMRDWEHRDELLTSVMVEKVVRKLMDTEVGEAVRKRAAKLGGELRKSMADGGVTHEDLNSLISYIHK
ncbi:putative trans-zeatin O-beta-D-glucosyltransferase [Helianthus annuus]|uniref:zeatin O-glucosyltransferase-like n=1 Tax=Helianthus annuus TaxID=4232 RepID=UPI000B9034F2|nr:zeatin O-glucosyltransferase-like [Helianthus annuus]KAJ0513413.1 putative trans-zeatin O-beta-D-glucosyltransferase [Helianthus annuus]KAJ0521253.1 putative trans-zeatin O-beta-D-glucosyltransferase [Helianthus annuus]KAJ0529528.1 putative trans-zeatin O-beta-D-glucosyltransferase [Helianthus annuus]KAJ0696412.1 putative trans-zeatin O-beta-D-glucosyltransferase [Helianthus annuus]KAJ0879051.1 putative trans-zeatin O-beta-D-glucosyltransferase [Helianthus annuus]